MIRSLSDVDRDIATIDEKLETIRSEARSLVDAIGDGQASAGQLEALDRYRSGTEKAFAERDRLRDERTQLNEDYIRMLGQRPQNTEAIGQEDQYERHAPSVDVRTVSRSRAESVALRAVERFPMAPRAQDRLDAVIRDTSRDPLGLGARYLAAVADPNYMTAFGKILANPTTAHLRMTPQELESVRTVQAIDEQRAMSLAGSAGGFAVPFELDPTIIPTSNGVLNPLRQLARVVTIATDTWRGVSSGAITASYAAEATETTDNSPTLAQPEISTEKAQAFVPFSIEIGMDWPRLQAELGRLLAEAKDALESSKFLAGSGTNEPFGVLTGTTNTVNAGAGGTFTVDNVYALQAALPPRYQPRVSFLASGTILNSVYRLVGTGDPVEPPLMSSDRTRLLGKPVFEASDMATATTVGLKFLLYGEFSRFVIVDRIGLQVELIPHLFGTNHRPTGQRGLYSFWRNSSKVVDANAFRALLGLA